MSHGSGISKEKIDEYFDQNADELEAEGTHALSAWSRAVARAQVQLYWQRLQHIAEQVTDTEVRLQLRSQKTPDGRIFGIEGIVDIVREADGRTTMYDIKTHDAEYVRENSAQYEKQLNIYAHIWSELRGERLDDTAVICTTLPKDVESSYNGRDSAALAIAMAKWEPVIPIEYKRARVKATIREFGEAVDGIEKHHFSPPPVGRLNTPLLGTRTKFAVYVCRNCDARYSCRSYQKYSLGSRGRSESAVAAFLVDVGDDDARDDFAIAALEVDPPLGSEEADNESPSSVKPKKKKSVLRGAARWRPRFPKG